MLFKAGLTHVVYVDMIVYETLMLCLLLSRSRWLLDAVSVLLICLEGYVVSHIKMV